MACCSSVSSETCSTISTVPYFSKK
jgi:hypothetical protein